jgi:hypothetical protein
MDGSLWPALLEKAWAKVNGNYENIGAGFGLEPLTFLTNIPTRKYNANDLSLDSLWKIVDD